MHQQGDEEEFEAGAAVMEGGDEEHHDWMEMEVQGPSEAAGTFQLPTEELMTPSTRRRCPYLVEKVKVFLNTRWLFPAEWGFFCDTFLGRTQDFRNL